MTNHLCKPANKTRHHTHIDGHTSSWTSSVSVEPNISITVTLYFSLSLEKSLPSCYRTILPVCQNLIKIYCLRNWYCPCILALSARWRYTNNKRGSDGGDGGGSSSGSYGVVVMVMIMITTKLTLLNSGWSVTYKEFIIISSRKVRNYFHIIVSEGHLCKLYDMDDTGYTPLHTTNV